MPSIGAFFVSSSLKAKKKKVLPTTNNIIVPKLLIAERGGMINGVHRRPRQYFFARQRARLITIARSSPTVRTQSTIILGLHREIDHWNLPHLSNLNLDFF